MPLEHVFKHAKHLAHSNYATSSSSSSHSSSNTRSPAATPAAQQQHLHRTGWHSPASKFMGVLAAGASSCRCADKSLSPSPPVPNPSPVRHPIPRTHLVSSRERRRVPMLPMLLGKLIIGINYAFALCGQLFKWLEWLAGVS